MRISATNALDHVLQHCIDCEDDPTRCAVILGGFVTLLNNRKSLKRGKFNDWFATFVLSTPTK